MNTIASPVSRKRPVNLTLNDDLIQQVRLFSSNLSGVVETLPADYVRQQTQLRQTHRQEANLTAQVWNDFNSAAGSFADQHSTL